LANHVLNYVFIISGGVGVAGVGKEDYIMPVNAKPGDQVLICEILRSYSQNLWQLRWLSIHING